MQNDYWAVVKYLGATDTRGARWSVRVGKTRCVVPYAHEFSGVDRAIEASRDFVRARAGASGHDVVYVVEADYIESLGVYIVVWRYVRVTDEDCARWHEWRHSAAGESFVATNAASDDAASGGAA